MGVSGHYGSAMLDATGERWSNWAGNQTARARNVAHPRGIEEIAAAVMAATARDQRVKAIGSGYACSGVAVTDGVQVRLDRHARLLEVDVDGGLVTVEAGMTLGALAGELASVDLALDSLGGDDAQTLGGAISTGSHGADPRRGGLASQVRAVTIVLADGSAVRCSAAEEPDLFAAALVGLGAFGVVASYTIAVVPAFALHVVRESAAFSDMVDGGGFAAATAAADHAELRWFPHTTRCVLTRGTRVGMDALAGPRRRRARHDQLTGALFGMSTSLGKLAPALIPGLNRLAVQALPAGAATVPPPAVAASRRRTRFLEMEYALPPSRLADVLTELRSFVGASGLEISFPVTVRFSAADDVWLSTAYEQTSAYLAVRVVRGSPYDRYFHGVEQIVGQVGGRPQWGTLHSLDAAALAGRYPRFAEAMAVRDRVDPARVFGNDLTHRVFGA